jgi:deoxyribodipyrimidine photolyase-related protein
MSKSLRLILGDQLNHQHSWFQQVDPNIGYVLMEIRSETDYVTHHIQKVCAFFAAMRAFAQHLNNLGHTVHYFQLDQANNTHSFKDNIQLLVKELSYTQIAYQEPDEYRLDRELAKLSSELGLPTEMVGSEHYYTSRQELAQFFKGKKTFLLESFYRAMRKKHNVLMQTNNEPVGDKWNFDADNRKPYDNKVPVPPIPNFATDCTEIVQMLEKAGVKTMGSIPENLLPHPVMRNQSLKLLNLFVIEFLPWFGKYEDAMDTRFKQLFHSRLSFAMNVKLLSPMEVIEAVVRAYESQTIQIPLESVEGFIRQILGWREYMRGIYWSQMPEYATLNFLEHKRPLPPWFWTGETKMNCLKHSIGQSLDMAYAHHIQRLMIIGNFALLYGAHPDEVDAWYLGVYIDAIEWVEITNTRGMSQYADGGIVGSKPYVSSANYIQKMSNYCKGCHYNAKEKVGENACPFNSLYWHFYDRHQDKLAKNPRIGMAYVTLNKMNPTDKEAIMKQAEKYIAGVEGL